MSWSTGEFDEAVAGSVSPDASRFHRQPERLPYKSQARQQRRTRPASAFANSKSEFTIEQEQMNGGPHGNRKWGLHKGEKEKMLRRQLAT